MLVEQSGTAVAGDLPYQDLPLNGVLLVGLAAFGLRHDPPEQRDDAVRLLAIADRWSYNRSFPVMAWDRMVALADEAAPGRLAAIMEEYADRAPADLVADAREVLLRLTSSW